MTKEEREEREYISRFTDERYAKKAWKEAIGESLQSAAAILDTVVDAKGNPTLASIIYDTARRNVADRLAAKGISRAPQKMEVLIEANVIRGSFDATTFNTLLDRTAGKVKDELNITAGAFEELSDEELEVLHRHREQKLLKAEPEEAEDDNP